MEDMDQALSPPATPPKEEDHGKSLDTETKETKDSIKESRGTRQGIFTLLESVMKVSATTLKAAENSAADGIAKIMQKDKDKTEKSDVRVSQETDKCDSDDVMGTECGGDEDAEETRSLADSESAEDGSLYRERTQREKTPVDGWKPGDIPDTEDDDMSVDTATSSRMGDSMSDNSLQEGDLSTAGDATKPGIFSCSKCGRMFSRIQALKSHMKSHRKYVRKSPFLTNRAYIKVKRRPKPLQPHKVDVPPTLQPQEGDIESVMSLLSSDEEEEDEEKYVTLSRSDLTTNKKTSVLENLRLMMKSKNETPTKSASESPPVIAPAFTYVRGIGGGVVKKYKQSHDVSVSKINAPRSAEKTLPSVPVQEVAKIKTEPVDAGAEHGSGSIEGRRSSLNRKRYATLESPVKPDLPCEVCGKEFKCTQGLTMHLKSHGIFRSKRSDAETGIIRHTISGRSIKINQCPVCRKMFKHRGAMMNHRKSHQQEEIEAVLGKNFHEIEKAEETLPAPKSQAIVSDLNDDYPPPPVLTREEPLPGGTSASGYLNEVEDRAGAMDAAAAEPGPSGPGEDFRTAKPFVCGICGAGFSVLGDLGSHMAECQSKNSSSGEASKQSDSVSQEEDLQGMEEERDSVLEEDIKMAEEAGLLEAGEDEEIRQLEANGDKVARIIEEPMENMGVEGENPYRCIICSQDFSARGTLRDHVRLHRNDTNNIEKVQCPVCQQKFMYSANLMAHMPIHTETKEWRCTICQKLCPTQEQLAHHLRFHTGEISKCDECGKVFASPKSWFAHMKRHAGLKTHPHCKICGKRFQRKHTKDVHIVQFHPELAEQEGVDVEAVNKMLLESEEEKKKAIEARYAKYQTYVSSFKPVANRPNVVLHGPGVASDLAMHSQENWSEMGMAYVKGAQRPYKCLKCDKSYLQRASLIIHSRTHTGERPYKCRLCDKAFREKGVLTKHMVVHMAHDESTVVVTSKGEQGQTIKKEPQDLQPLELTQADILELTEVEKLGLSEEERQELAKVLALERSDTGEVSRVNSPAGTPGTPGTPEPNESQSIPQEKPGQAGNQIFKCHICRKLFRFRGNLNKHLKVHSGIKRFSCTMCGKGFMTSSNLKRHMTTHSNEKPHPCKACDKAFKRKDLLTNHMKVMHDVDYQETPGGGSMNATREREVSSITPVLVTKVKTEPTEEPNDQEDLAELREAERLLGAEEESKSEEEDANVDSTNEAEETSDKVLSPAALADMVVKQEPVENEMGTVEEDPAEEDGEEDINEEDELQAMEEMLQKSPSQSQNSSPSSKLHPCMSGRSDDRPYGCELCEKAFKSSYELKVHYRVHTGERPYKCNICQRAFTQISNLRRHMQMHGARCSVSCNLCGKVYTTSGDLGRHLTMEHLSDPKYKLTPAAMAPVNHPAPPRQPLTKSEVIKKTETILQIPKVPRPSLVPAEEEGPFDQHVCKVCGVGFQKGNSLVAHMKCHAEETPYSCNICGHKTKGKQYMSQHFRKHMIIGNNSCGQCRKDFQSLEKLTEHMMQQHIHMEPIKCQDCGKSFLYMTQLRMHMIVHAKNTLKMAKVTKDISATATRDTEVEELPAEEEMPSLEEEEPMDEEETMIEEEWEEGEEFDCEEDDPEENMEEDLDSVEVMKPNAGSRHVSYFTAKTHPDSGGKDVKPYVCKVCGLAVKYYNNLISHMRVHSQDKSQTCPICKKSFAMTTNMKVHMRTHTGEKPYVCQICRKGFAVSGQLKTHMRSHTGERPFVCTKCGLTFVQSAHLTRHIDTYHTEDEKKKRYECPVCHRLYRHSSSVKQHMEKDHADHVDSELL